MPYTSNKDRSKPPYTAQEYKLYADAVSSFETGAADVAEQIAAMGHYHLYRPDGTPFCTRRVIICAVERLSPHPSDSDAVNIDIGYLYSDSDRHEAFAEGMADGDFVISASFPVRYLWNRCSMSSLLTDLREGRICFSLEGDTSGLTERSPQQCLPSETAGGAPADSLIDAVFPEEGVVINYDPENKEGTLRCTKTGTLYHLSEEVRSFRTPVSVDKGDVVLFSEFTGHLPYPLAGERPFAIIFEVKQLAVEDDK